MEKKTFEEDRYFRLRYNDFPAIQCDAIHGHGIVHFIRLCQLSFNFVLIALHKSQRIKACGGQLIMAFELKQRRRFELVYQIKLTIKYKQKTWARLCYKTDITWL